MDLKKTESGTKYVRPAAMADVFKPLRATDSNRSMVTSKAGISLASVRRDINKTISDEIVEALKEGRSLEELFHYSTDSGPHRMTGSVPSFKFVSKQLSSLIQPKSNRNSTSTEELSRLLGEGKSGELISYLGSFISDVERLSSVLNIATHFVDGVISDAFKTLDNMGELHHETKPLVPLKDLCLKSEEARRDRPSVFDLAKTVVDNILKESMRRATNMRVLGIDRFQTYNSLYDFKVKDGLEIVAKCISNWSFNNNWFYRTLYHGRMISKESHSYFYTVRWSVPTPSYPVAQVTVDVNFTVEVVPLTLKTSPFYIEDRWKSLGAVRGMTINIPSDRINQVLTLMSDVRSGVVVNVKKEDSFGQHATPLVLDCSSEVWYRVETDRSHHSAFNSQFYEKWLQCVVKRKLQAFKMFKF